MTITLRESQEDREIIARIIAEKSLPGVTLTTSDAIRIALAEWAQNHPEEKMNANRLTKNTTCYLENPWSGTVTEMTWGEIVKWAEENVHDSARAEWMREARRAAAAGDSKTLGTMIIGS